MLFFPLSSIINFCLHSRSMEVEPNYLSLDADCIGKLDDI